MNCLNSRILKINYMKNFYYVFVTGMLLLGQAGFSQITTNGSMTPVQLVQNVLLGAGVTATNITYTGYANSISSFSATPSPATNLGFNAGLYLTSGSYLATDPSGNGNPGEDGPFGPSSNFQTVDNGTSGDTDLDAVSGFSTYDAAVLEFDFIPQSDSVKFKYVFGSEEYNDYVFGSVNDAFAFILSGVTTTLAPVNIAIIPGTSTPVSINTVNNGGPTGGVSTGPCLNCAFYRDNINSSINCAYDGLTAVLTAKHAVICGETYHIKIAIADAGDHVFDSGVFLEAGSFSSSAPFAISTIGTSVGPIGSANTLYENCGALNLVFTRPPGTVATADTLVVTINGTASPSDYTGLNDTVFFPIGVDTVLFPVYAPNEGIADAGETVHIYYTYTNPCNVVDTIDYTFTILEPPPFTHTLSNDTTICSAANALLSSTVMGGVSPYLINWSNQGGATVSSGTSYNAPPVIQTYYYYVTDACRQDTLFDSVHVGVNTFLYLTGSLNVIGSANDTVMVEGCGSAVLTFTENGAGAGVGVHVYNITINGTIDNAGGTDLGVTIPTTITMNNQTTQTFNLSALTDVLAEGDEYITITIDYANNPCIPVSGLVVKTLHIKDPAPFSVQLPEDTTICKGRGIPIKAIPTGGGGTITYAWQPNSTATASLVVVTPTVTTTYYVTATESCNGMTDTDSIHVTVLFDPPVVNALSLDSVCAGESYHFVTSVSHGVGQVTGHWLPGYVNDLQADAAPNSWVIYGAGTTENYIYSVKDQCNAVDFDTLSLQVVDCTPIVPNVVTVNGDDVNDVFYIRNLDKNPGTAVTVFDRWGKKVFESADYNNKWKPSELHDGVYFYIVEPQIRDKQNGYLHVFSN
ncbi:MAG: hypothetical protein K0S33_2513 [Bacteroidetes bacterium]|nr:hypothetical protein [Bacteroidota bacterium]